MPDRVEFVKYIPLTASIRAFQGLSLTVFGSPQPVDFSCCSPIDVSGYQIWGREKGGGLWCCAEVMESVGV